jgi:hypothetical protein
VTRPGPALALAGLVLAAAPPPARAEPRCVVEADLDRTRAFVGEQLHYHVRVLRRPDATHGWETPLSFPRARAEWLVGLAAGDRGPREGPRRIALSEHRAVFPAHPGPLRVEGASIRCAAADGDEVVPVPAVEAQIDALPAEGRPAGFGGLVGPVRWSAGLTPDRVDLGGSTRLSVVVIGSGNTWLAPSAWGTGANTEAKKLLLEHAFEDEGFHRVEFKTDARNARSRAALAALPATFEGVFRKHMVVRGGERRDSAWYAVLDDDWPVVKACLDRRLAGRPGVRHPQGV